MTRARYLALALATVALGLVVHFHGAALGRDALSRDARDITGDALWAGMIFWLVSAVAPRLRMFVRGAIALGVCVVVETSQCVHTPKLDALRATTVGHLILGSGFDPRDFASYALGVFAATLVAYGLTRAHGRE